MPPTRLSVVVTRRLPEPVETRVKELSAITLNKTDPKMSPKELGESMRRADVIVPCVTDRIDRTMLAAAGDRVKLIANYGAGVDHPDTRTARHWGIVCRTPAGCSDEEGRGDREHLARPGDRQERADPDAARGRTGGTGRGVFAHGHELNPRLRAVPNLAPLAQVGSVTVKGRIEMSEQVIININPFADGQRPPDLVVASLQ